MLVLDYGASVFFQQKNWNGICNLAFLLWFWVMFLHTCSYTVVYYEINSYFFLLYTSDHIYDTTITLCYIYNSYIWNKVHSISVLDKEIFAGIVYDLVLGSCLFRNVFACSVIVLENTFVVDHLESFPSFLGLPWRYFWRLAMIVSQISDWKQMSVSTRSSR